jgi:hypothetical protein
MYHIDILFKSYWLIISDKEEKADKKRAKKTNFVNLLIDD